MYFEGSVGCDNLKGVIVLSIGPGSHVPIVTPVPEGAV